MRSIIGYGNVLWNIREAAENGAVFTKDYIERCIFNRTVDTSKRYDMDNGKLFLYVDMEAEEDVYISVGFVRVSKSPELFSVHYIDAPYDHLMHYEYHD